MSDYIFITDHRVTRGWQTAISQLFSITDRYQAHYKTSHSDAMHWPGYLL